MDEIIDVNDVSDRVFVHMILQSYVLTLFFIEAVFIVLHYLASLYFVNFQITNPICVLLAMELCWITYKHVSTRFLQKGLWELLSTIALIVMGLPLVITPGNVLGLIQTLLDVSRFSLIITAILFVFLFLALV